jgi:predicted AAA+ superfamily ATPase
MPIFMPVSGPTSMDADEVTRVLESLNPWWSDGEVPKALLGIPRDPAGPMPQMLAAEEVLTLVGVRRSGKSTILRQIASRLLGEGVPPSNVVLVDFEDPRTSGLSVRDVVSAHRRLKAPEGRTIVMLDEVQASAGWEGWVRAEYERHRGVKFIVTGSSSSLLRSDLARVLAGRTLTVPVLPLSFREFLRFRRVAIDGLSGDDLADAAIHQLDRYLDVGGFPKAVLGDDALRPMLLKDYLDVILYRDVVHRHGADAAKVERLATYLLSNLGTLQHQGGLAASTVVSPPTVEAYLRHLEEASLVVPVGALTFKTKPASTRRLGVKYYCIDTGLRNAVAVRKGPDRGRLLENAVCIEWLRRGVRPLYWRNQGEVDFVTGTRPGAIVPMNVCSSDAVPEREFGGVSSFADHVPPPLGPPVILTRSREGNERGVALVPAWKWLLGR